MTQPGIISYTGGNIRSGGPSTQHQREYLSLSVSSVSGTAVGQLLAIASTDTSSHVCFWGAAVSYDGASAGEVTYAIRQGAGGQGTNLFQERIVGPSGTGGSPGSVTNFQLRMPVKLDAGTPLVVDVDAISAGKFYCNIYYTLVTGNL